MGRKAWTWGLSRVQRRTTMQPIWNSYFGHRRRGCQRSAEETFFGLGKVARIV